MRAVIRLAFRVCVVGLGALADGLDRTVMVSWRAVLYRYKVDEGGDDGNVKNVRMKYRLCPGTE